MAFPDSVRNALAGAAPSLFLPVQHLRGLADLAGRRPADTREEHEQNTPILPFPRPTNPHSAPMPPTRPFNSPYEGSQLDHLAFPLGGLGAGMFCVEGTGALTHFSLQNRPDVWNSPVAFAAISIRQPEGPNIARVLEGPVPAWKPFFPFDRHWRGSGTGAGTNTFGLPRFNAAKFTARFPFAEIELGDPEVPLACSLTGWSPFLPGNADDSGLPAGALEYKFKNNTAAPIEAVWSFHLRHFLARPVLNVPLTKVDESQATTGMPGGFILRQGPVPEDTTIKTDLAAWTDAPGAKVNLALFRGGWFDALTMIWKSIGVQVRQHLQPLG